MWWRRKGSRREGWRRISELSHAMLGYKNTSLCYHKGILSLTHPLLLDLWWLSWERAITIDNWWPVGVCVCMWAQMGWWICGWVHVFIRVCVCSCSCMYIKCVSVWVCSASPCLHPHHPPSVPTPTSPSLSLLACQWYGPLIGGPGLSRHGNCTKANKGVERSRGNTVTQRGYLAQWKISGESHKAEPLLNSKAEVACVPVINNAAS